MKTSPTHAAAPDARPRSERRERGERGAALIMALLMTTLLLAAGGALILTSSMAATTAVDATAEMQAYYAAEAGLEASLAVLRRNVQSNTAPALSATFRNAVCGTANTSCNNTGGTFSQWLTYAGGVVSIGNNLSYSLTVRDASVTAGAAVPDSPYSPRYLVITSTGRGPKGAVKVLEMTVDEFSFDFTARAAVAVRSNDDPDTPMAACTLGNSSPHLWNGNDNYAAYPASSVAAMAVTNRADYDGGDGLNTGDEGFVEEVINGDSDNVIGASQLQKLDPDDLEYWLQDADLARLFLTEMRAKAVQTGRLNPNNLGTNAAPKFSFVDGDVTLNGNNDSGAGLLVVTGTYSQGGSAKFNGIILALGDGVIARNGNPDTFGAMVVASFNHTWDAATQSYTGAGDFLSPSITTQGGGNSTVGYHSDWVRKAMGLLGARVTGIVER